MGFAHKAHRQRQLGETSDGVFGSTDVVDDLFHVGREPGIGSVGVVHLGDRRARAFYPRRRDRLTHQIRTHEEVRVR